LRKVFIRLLYLFIFLAIFFMNQIFLILRLKELIFIRFMLEFYLDRFWNWLNGFILFLIFFYCCWIDVRFNKDHLIPNVGVLFFLF
jgi:hypothetical protein